VTAAFEPSLGGVGDGPSDAAGRLREDKLAEEKEEMANKT